VRYGGSSLISMPRTFRSNTGNFRHVCAHDTSLLYMNGTSDSTDFGIYCQVPEKRKCCDWRKFDVLRRGAATARK